MTGRTLHGDRQARAKAFAVPVVEAAYDLELDTRAWLAQLLERAAPGLDWGLGLAATLWRMGHGVEPATMVTLGMEDRVRDALLNAGRDDAASADRQARTGNVYTTSTQCLGLDEAAARTFGTFVKHFHPVGVRDCLHLSAPDPSGLRVLIVAPIADVGRPSPSETATWTRVGMHIAAGARLRGAGAGAKGELAADADAVLSSSGAVVHAGDPARSAGAREALQRAARAVDQARTTARGDDERALTLWRGLVAGRWSLVDRFDTDGRRFVVARRNDPDVKDPRALTRRERQVLAYAAMGHPLKLIAYSLGLGPSTVALHRTRAMRKLGLTSMAEVVQLFAAPAPGRGAS